MSGKNLALINALKEARSGEINVWDEEIENMKDEDEGKTNNDASENGKEMDIGVNSDNEDYKMETVKEIRGELYQESSFMTNINIGHTGSQLYNNQDMMSAAKYIPLRLSYDERKNLRRVLAAISVIDYTSMIDVPLKKTKRIRMQLQHICAFFSGVIASISAEDGKHIISDRNYKDYVGELGEMLEITRRYKITNPEKLRSEYGKLILLMQDVNSEQIKDLVGLDVNEPVATVYALLESKGALKILKDKRINIATKEIMDDKSKSRHEIDASIRKKNDAIRAISREYSSQFGDLTSDDIENCLYSIGDNESFLNSNRQPVDMCIRLLQKFFAPDNVEEGYSLAIEKGISGARLNHSHALQYNYVLQSLTLWRNVIDDLFRLWYLAEEDLLDPNEPYDLKETPQGLQRIQKSPRVYAAMKEILEKTKKSLGGWIGSSVIHLGDHNVPNALIFIDKYIQVAKILSPLITVLKNLNVACSRNKGVERYMDTYGGVSKAQKDILLDFFRYGFDGSGGDNDFDAGSCIDGRLTSTWNWCSQLMQKPFAPLFRLTGFSGFDGEWEN